MADHSNQVGGVKGGVPSESGPRRILEKGRAIHQQLSLGTYMHGFNFQARPHPL